jgi:hypothetical protein
MPAFLSNKYVQFALVAVAAVIVEKKTGIVSKVVGSVPVIGPKLLSL